MLLLSLGCLIVFLVHPTHGHSSGAQNESCDFLTVTHTHLGSTVLGTPCSQDPCRSHQLLLIGSLVQVFTYDCGQTYQLQLFLNRAITGNPTESINGYMVAPRVDTGRLGPDVAYVGTWELGPDQKHVCGEQAITQSRALVDTVAVNMTWRAPVIGSQNVAFWFVVVPSNASYYLPVRSLLAKPSPVTCCSPCMNGGALLNNTCTCACPAAYTGTVCETCAQTCQNGGTLNTGACTCDCIPGFSGSSCEIGAPVFTATPEDTVVALTDADGNPGLFSLQCQVTGDPTPTIAWFRAGNEIEGETSTTLTVSPITGTDATVSGVEYYCEANNSFGRIRSRTANVQLASFGAWTVSGANTVDARSGFSVAIPCNPPPANPPPIVFWQADGVNITAGDPLAGGADDRVQVLPSGHLVIHQLEASDFATFQYKCSVSNANTHTISPSPQKLKLSEVENLPALPNQTDLHVFYHEPTVQVERGKMLHIFNVVQPTVAEDFFSYSVPNIALQNQWDIYTVNNVQVSDAGQLYVEYNSSGAELGSLTTQISVYDPAEVTSISGPYQVFAGQPVTLTCTIAAIPAADVMWYKDGIAITPGGRIRIDTTADTNTRLIIDSATVEDNGMYQCFVSNDHGDDVGTISLQVHDNVLILLQSLDRETLFLEGDNRTLTVSVLSDEQPTMTWFVNGQRLTSSNSFYKIGSIETGSRDNRGVTQYNITLSIYFLNTMLEGEYKLVALSNGLVVETAGNVLQERLTNVVTVEVVDSPCLYVGTNVTLRCQPDGVPRSTVTWLHNDFYLSPYDRYPNYLFSNDPDFTITIINVTASDAGSYTCNATNTLSNWMSAFGVGTAIFGINCVSPTITQANDDSVDLSPLLLAGESVNLTCTAIGTPRPQIRWYRGKHRILTSSRAQIIETEIDSTTLQSMLNISSAEVDSGTYECHVENELGTTALQFQVVIGGCPAEQDTTCSNVSAVTWPVTPAGSIASISCPCGVRDPMIQQLTATRRCGAGTDGGHGVWEEPQCDSCMFSATTLALCELTEVSNSILITTSIITFTETEEVLESQDISLIANLLETVSNRTQDLQQEEVQTGILSIVSMVQGAPREEIATSQMETQSSTRLLQVVDSVLNTVETTADMPYEFAAPQLGVRVEDAPVLGEAEFFQPSLTGLLNKIRAEAAASMQMNELPPAMVSLLSTILRQSDNSGDRTRISTVIYGNDALFQQRAPLTSDSGSLQRQVGSIILDITFRRNEMVENIQSDTNSSVVRPFFTKTMTAKESGRNTKCQFWNFSLDSGYGAWDSRGCRVISDTAEATQCGCDHLTHFAILLDIDPTVRPVDLALTWVSYIGTSLSIICLIIIIITYLGEKNLRSTLYIKLLMNFCFALLGLYVTFIVSTVSTGVPVLCGLVSALMHYFFLAVFFWMAAEAFHLHRKLVTVFKPDIKYYLPIAMAVCWGVPALIVVVSLAPMYQNYIHQQFCRVYSYPFWIGLVVPFGIIYIINWIVFFIIIFSLVCRPSVQVEVGKKGKLRKVKENFMIALGLSILFGLGWSIGLLASSDLPNAVRQPAEWIFTILTAFLGLYLFLLYVIRSQEARKAWKRWLLCRCKSMQRAAPSSLLRTFSATLGSWRSTLKADRGSRSGQSVSDKQSTLKSTLHSSNSTTFNVSPVGKATLPLSAIESTEEEVTGKNDRSVCYVNDASQPSTFDVHALQQCPVEEEEVFYYFY